MNVHLILLHICAFREAHNIMLKQKNLIKIQYISVSEQFENLGKQNVFGLHWSYSRVGLIALMWSLSCFLV